MLKEKLKNLVIEMMKLFPIKKNRCIFYSSYGANYGCNPKYISQYLKTSNKDIEIIWALNSPLKYNIEGIKIVKNMSLKYFYNLATSKVIITNFRTTRDFQKRKKQKYIQTWHSSLRLKQIEKDAETSLPKDYIFQAIQDSKKIDYLVSGCRKSTEIFKESFWYDGVILESGTPRNDFLFSITEVERKNIKNSLGIDDNEKIVLYAPTFRKENNLDIYNLNYNNLLESLKIKFGGNWKVLLRLHPHLINLSSNIKGQNILDVTKYDDIQELLGVTDFLISDYSSLMFDYSITKKPCVLYTPDLNQYISSDRKLYFDIEKLPFKSVLTNEELNNYILDFEINFYENNLEKFLEGLGSYEDGKASERVADLIKTICAGE
ncbi:CDP-glycerol glycerophosphotransferase family protein [Cetobacterium sp.]|uniref:CDP-glycerol glycerophosphotransferase family protein n=1 Tax=Cetobacterium sp. TaxID=2071632 RepID=UPI003F33CAEA